MSGASSVWPQGGHHSGPRGSRRGFELVGIVFAFFWFWPAAAAYITWKLLGYPGVGELRGMVERGAETVRKTGFGGPAFDGTPFASRPFSAPFGGSGNAAFDEYRRGEIERLERERRKLDEEAREFRGFVEELKRAKDREEFDAYMARRRANGPTSV